MIANVITETAKYGLRKDNETPDNTPATKREIEDLKKLLGDRYRAIKNYKLGPNGEQHYFDLKTNEIIYFPKRTQNSNSKNQFDTANNVI